ncbi:hypothetical protein POJ06DRAFT_269801 [Lipomyces tetrasporus]|uniref:protein-histidine N-methyltransferase n=1 Tax=Lipomyces tetrasporus TaxID=54092 RepID=A0AAD7QP50_9ASCO|nr:uncharacterized protein POJ06DRAFT_269801 [Lipomyces tetrasporus]KAJ8098718.1 hypothetical protein POJ06DRAFT_269801 [Lipomyces tetrasporus]
MFKFNFSGDDIDGVEESEDQQQDETTAERQSANAESEFVLKPTMYDISDLLRNLPSRLSYRLVPVRTSAGTQEFPIPRREVFDIKVQIMANEEMLLPSLDDPSGTASEERDQFIRKELQILLSNTEDLRTELYEGGLKSWEGSGDLVEYLADKGKEAGNGILELGCGSALPSMYLFQKHLRSLRSASSEMPIPTTSFILSDYNYSVLRLMTAPNFLLAYYTAIVLPDIQSLTSQQDLDLEITPELVSQFLEFLTVNNIAVKFISGSWDSSEFSQLLGYSLAKTEQTKFSLVLASETIYSLSTIYAFTSLLIDCITYWGTSSERAESLVAAKEIYFAVGGTVRQFVELVRVLGGTVDTVGRIAGRVSGVARVVMHVTKP